MDFVDLLDDQIPGHGKIHSRPEITIFCRHLLQNLLDDQTLLCDKRDNLDHVCGLLPIMCVWPCSGHFVSISLLFLNDNWHRGDFLNSEHCHD